MRLATILCSALLFEALLLYLVAGWMHALGYPAVAAASSVLVLAGGWRFGLVVLSFRLTGAWTALVARPAWRRLAPIGREFVVMAWLYTVGQLGFGGERHGRRRPADAGPRVVLVHGFMCNAAVWSRLIARLNAAGFDDLHALNLDPLYFDPEGGLRYFEQRLQRLHAEAGNAPLVLIGHSMGGLLVRRWAQRHPQQAARVVCLAAPHRGTELACRFGGGGEHGPPSPNSRWLRAFNAAADRSVDAAILNLWSRVDNIVAPPEHAALPGAREWVSDRLGHLSLLFDDAVIEQVIAAIRPFSPNAEPIHR